MNDIQDVKYLVRKCRGHFHVTCDGEDIADDRSDIFDYDTAVEYADHLNSGKGYDEFIRPIETASRTSFPIKVHLTMKGRIPPIKDETDPHAVSDESRRLVDDYGQEWFDYGDNPYPRTQERAQATRAALLAHIASIEADREKAWALVNFGLEENERDCDEKAALRAELEEARKDTERLDWFESTGWQTIGRAFNPNSPQTNLQTWRVAIDGMRSAVVLGVNTGKTE